MTISKRFRAMMNRLPLLQQRLAWVDFAHVSYDGDERAPDRVVLDAPLEEANVITSLAEINGLGEPMHRPVIDIDHRLVVVESSTTGHSHLYVDLLMPQEDYFELLDVLVKVGLVEPGYVKASKARGYTAVRLPWVSKEQLTDEEVLGA